MQIYPCQKLKEQEPDFPDCRLQYILVTDQWHGIMHDGMACELPVWMAFTLTSSAGLIILPCTMQHEIEYWNFKLCGSPQ